jgi:hypothetical protein
MNLLQSFKSLVVAWISFTQEVISDIKKYKAEQYK